MSRDLPGLLAAVDLEALADQLLGGHRGHGRGARWPSPVPGHPQTGKSPPMSMFTDRSGVQRWSCWATGTSGTAIDLVATALSVDVAAAIDWLDARHGHGGAVAALPARRPSPPPPPSEPSASLRDYVAACRRLLWTPSGRDALRWLTGSRRLASGVVAANQVGFDPGPGQLRRARGLPYRGRGVVLPAFDEAGDLLYAQVRYLDPERAGRKYDNPAAAHGAKPTLSWPQPAAGTTPSGPIVVCEGTLDALTVVGAGAPAVALIAAGDAGRDVAAVAKLRGVLVVAVDNDAAGRDARQLLTARLAAAGRHDVAQLIVPGDLNELAQRAGSRFPAVLRAAIRGATHPGRRASGACRGVTP